MALSGLGYALASISVSPVNPSIALGLKQRFAATGNYSDGSTQDLTGSVSWSSASGGVASINAAGLATGVAAGVTTIAATLTPIIGSTALSIGHQGQFPATTLSFNLGPDVSLGQAVDAIHRAEREMGVPASINAEFSGTAQAFTSSLSSEPWLVLAKDLM